MNAQGKVVYLLKTPCRDGTTHVVFEPLDFPSPALLHWCRRPRVNLTSSTACWPEPPLACRR
ncbi:MAG: hypothetical protein IPG20_16910 [Gammaproteobacteria bacterium]|nr:hypothetical protein [Gammaproteobacteria bacterium]